VYTPYIYCTGLPYVFVCLEGRDRQSVLGMIVERHAFVCLVGRNRHSVSGMIVERHTFVCLVGRNRHSVSGMVIDTALKIHEPLGCCNRYV